METTHNHHHQHAHAHEHAHKIESLNSIFIVSIVLNLVYVAVEAGMGFFSGSLGLLSDAGHNMSDVFSLLLALAAFKLAKVHSNKHFTYGYKKSTVLISLTNAIILLVAVGAIVIESIHKFQSPAPINGSTVSVTAAVGIVVNGLTAWMLGKSQKNDLNVRGAFMHMLADTLVSVGVVVSGLVIMFTGWSVIDPIISLIIAFVILVSTWRLLSDSLRLSMDGMPEGIDFDKVESLLSSTEHVTDVHHLHIWPLSTTLNALTAHVVVDDISVMEKVKYDMKQRLMENGIAHSTLEFETAGCSCCHCNKNEALVNDV